MIEILIKRLSKNVTLPRYETEDSSGLDLAAHIDEKIKILPGKSEIIPTGLAVAIPKNFEIQIRPRSGLAAKSQISVLNTPGTIDADYRGEIKVILINLSDTFITGHTTICAMRKPFSTMKTLSLRLIKITLISPL